MIKTFINFLVNKPILCTFEVTKRCNSKCKMCNITSRYKNGDINKEIDLSTIENIFRQLKNFGIGAMLIQGGEPLIREDIIQIIALSNKFKFKTYLSTNGILLNENILNQLSKFKLIVKVSLDTLKRDIYKQIRGIDQLEHVKNNIKLLSKYQKLNPYIVMTLTDINYNEITDIYEFAKKHNAKFSLSIYNYQKQYASQKNDKFIIKNIDEAIHEIKKIRFGLRELIYTRNCIKYLKGKNLGICDAFFNSFRLNEKGELAPCLEMGTVFDLKKNDINLHWKNIKKRYIKGIIQCSKKTPCFYGCTRRISGIRRLKF